MDEATRRELIFPNPDNGIFSENAMLAELDRLSEQLLADPDSVCNDRFTHCTIFPKNCSVSVDTNPSPPA